MCHRERDDCKVGILPPRRRVHRHEERCARYDGNLNRDGKHALQIVLLETLVDAAESHAPHFRVDQIRPVAHDDF